MTLQVGMTGVDGLVLVGDTKQFKEPPQGIWSSYHSSKIKIGDNGKIAIACARNMLLADRIAEEILANIAECDVQSRGRRILDIGTKLAMPDKAGAECIVAFAEPEPSLHLFQLVSDGTPYCTIPVDRTVSGNSGNAAYFWAERYYKQSLRVEQLVRLGAHIVVAAGKLSSGSIGGLEIVTCDSSGFHRWAKQQNKEAEFEAARMGEYVGGLILGDSANALS